MPALDKDSKGAFAPSGVPSATTLLEGVVTSQEAFGRPQQGRAQPTTAEGKGLCSALCPGLRGALQRDLRELRKVASQFTARSSLAVDAVAQRLQARDHSSAFLRSHHPNLKQQLPSRCGTNHTTRLGQSKPRCVDAGLPKQKLQLHSARCGDAMLCGSPGILPQQLAMSKLALGKQPLVMMARCFAGRADLKRTLISPYPSLGSGQTLLDNQEGQVRL